MTDSEPTVSLVIPATPDFLRLARLTCADIGSRAGFDVEEIDDLRMGVNELCHQAIGQGSAGSVALEFAIGPERVVVTGRATGTAAKGDNAFTEAILRTVADAHEFVEDGDVRRFRLEKKRRR
jgi:anti-sigma regulatory factor (Ser/Thr protein kinase)